MKSNRTMGSLMASVAPHGARDEDKPLLAAVPPLPSGRTYGLVRFLPGAGRRGMSTTAIAVVGVAVAFAAGCRTNPFATRDGRFAPVPEGELLPTRAGVNDPEGLSAIQEFLERTAEYEMEGSAVAPADTTAASSVARRSNEMRRVPSGRQNLDEPIRANAPMVAAAPVEMMPALALPVVGSVSVRPLADTEAAPAPKPVRPAANMVNIPLDTQAVQRPMDLSGIVARLEAQANDSEDFDAQWRLRLTQLALHRDDEAASFPSSFPGGAILAALMRTAAAVRRVASDPSGSGDEAVTSVAALTRMLAARADPQVTAIRLCRKVVTFGVYEEMLDTEFVAGRTVRTIVYTELRNLRSEQTDDGQFRTNLATRIEVLSVDGESVWHEEEPEIVDLCRVPRMDFFVAQRIALPPTLPAGDYVLKVLVEDKLSGKADEGTRPFSLKSQFSIANGG